jgi:ABC-type antimicrobial peptide transport system permease subunit
MNPSWAPDFPGVTDAKNCRDWQPGIPMKLDAIRDKDEAYWKQYKTTPKAFIDLAAGQKLWSNRFGDLTAIRFPDTGQDANKLREQLASNLRLADIGLVASDFRAAAAAAAEGSVDFGGLFIGLSLFLIAASLVFAALLLLFTLENRAGQIGLLFSIGWREKQVRRSILWEAGLIAFCGSLSGLIGGLVYTRCALAGLNGVWSDATAGLKLVQDFQPQTLAIALATSLIVSLSTIWIATRRIFKARPKDLLAGDAWARNARTPAVELELDDRSVVVPAARARGGFMRFMPGLCLLLALGLSIAGARATRPEAVAGMFFGSGFCLLAAGLVGIRRVLAGLNRSPMESRCGIGPKTAGGLLPVSANPAPSASLAGLGLRNVTRRPGRSLAVTGMMAGGIFLVIAVNAFRLGSESDPSNRASGTGGFALIGESTLPVYEDLNTPAAWDAFALDDKIMKQVRVVPFRVREGDDASCLNLNKAQRPVLCAVNPALLAERKAFSFAKGSWDALALGSKSEIPAIADQATAMWGLGKGVGDTIDYTDAQGRAFKVKLAGLLAGSVLQGKVIVSEDEFLRRFPDTAGYKFFLVDAGGPDQTEIRNPKSEIGRVRPHLTQQLATRGLALEAAAGRLAAFNAVQNTYIGIFTVLGGLGVLLGTFGLGVLAMRNVLERRGEFGLMQALGFKPGALRAMVLSEHAALLAGGLLLGIVSAALAVWPNVRQSAAALPYAFLIWLNLGILAFGIAACWLAAVLALRGRLLDAVRRE